MTSQTKDELVIDVVVTPEVLTDGSVVWNVSIGNLVLHAYDEENAEDLANALSEAIDAHTTDVAHITIETWKLPRSQRA